MATAHEFKRAVVRVDLIQCRFGDVFRSALPELEYNIKQLRLTDCEFTDTGQVDLLIVLMQSSLYEGLETVNIDPIGQEAMQFIDDNEMERCSAYCSYTFNADLMHAPLEVTDNGRTLTHPGPDRWVSCYLQIYYPQSA